MPSSGAPRVRVASPPLDDHPSSYVVRDFVRSLGRRGVDTVPLPRRVGSVLARSGLTLKGRTRHLVIVPMMGLRADVLAAACLVGVPIPFCWDVWEPQWDQWTHLLNRVRPPLVVTTARASAHHLASTLHSSVVVHLPEAIDIDRYRPGAALSARRIDVLEMGRRNSHWHDAIRPSLAEHGLEHRYERRRGEVVFSGEAALVAGLTASKVSVCFPSAVTHPERSGSVSTLTSRYLESMASRCLVLGQAPEDLVDLLGLQPVVEAEMARPWDQLQSVLARVESYQAQVDAAYEQLRLVGGWDHRSRQLLEQIRAL